MSLKLWLLALTLFLIVALSGVVSSADVGFTRESLGGTTSRPWSGTPTMGDLFSSVSGVPARLSLTKSGSILPNAYTPDKINKELPNLIIGGIRQLSPDPCKNPIYMKFADNNGAIYVPTYYSGPAKDDADNWAKSIADGLDVNDAAKSKPTDENGLTRHELNYHKYDTIITYSGGTASAVTALDKQGVTCNTLILISPMKGMLSDKEYKQEITRILDNGVVKNIVVLWSPKDTPPGNLLGYQASPLLFGGDSRIAVYKVPLTRTGVDGHIEMRDFAIKTINNGVYDPQGRCAAKPNQLSGEYIRWQWLQSLTQEERGYGDYIGKGSYPGSGIVKGSYPGSGRSLGQYGSSGTPSLPPGIQEAVDNMQPVGEYNHYESTIPVFYQAGL